MKPLPTNTSFYFNCSHDECVEIQAEAYYRAIKRIESEKNALERNPPKRSLSKKEKYQFFSDIFFRPKKLRIKREHLADNLLLATVATILDSIGHILRLFALCLFLYGIYGFIALPTRLIMNIFNVIFAIPIIFLGGIYEASSMEIENSKDYNKLYAYSASIMSALAVIIAVCALFIQALGGVL